MNVRTPDQEDGLSTSSALPKANAAPTRRGLAVFALAIFTSAFLLFSVQPLAGRLILPRFGSAIGVWTTCMLFFQTLLLAGYAYAHLCVKLLSARAQALLHVALIACALATLPIASSFADAEGAERAPALELVLILTRGVGLPFLVIAATGPLLLAWRARLRPMDGEPYRLYALSNLGSLGALIAYPFVFERVMTLHAQSLAWSGGFAFCALLLGLSAWRFARDANRASNLDDKNDARTAGNPRRELRIAMAHDPSQHALDWIRWFMLAAIGSALLHAITNLICLDLAAVPLLWVMPLAIYLLSFIFAFAGPRMRWRPLWFGLLPAALGVAIVLLRDGVDTELSALFAGTAVVLMVGCMCCHGELARRQPPPHALTLYFLVIAIGGAAGGFFVAILAPALFRGLIEVDLALAAVALIGADVVIDELRSARRAPVNRGRGRGRGARWFAAIFWGLGMVAIGGLVWRCFDARTWVDVNAQPTLAQRIDDWLQSARWIAAVVLALPVIAWVVMRWRARSAARSTPLPAQSLTRSLAHLVIILVTLCGLMALAFGLLWLRALDTHKSVKRDRNFYGTLAIVESDSSQLGRRITLQHGRIRHGTQLAEHPDWPTTYYGPLSGGGFAIQRHPMRQEEGRQFRVGVVGLGAGTLAAYANAWIDPEWGEDEVAAPMAREPADFMHFYEINPLVIEWADTEFTYLADARARGAKVQVSLGDARMVMAQQLARGEPQRFDVLVIDAFSSDAIPLHLLTIESMRIYWGHLDADGILALHVSNRFVDLVPVCLRAARETGHELAYLINDADRAHDVGKSNWVLITSNRIFIDVILPAAACAPLPEPGPLFTDDFHSLIQILRR